MQPREALAGDGENVRPQRAQVGQRPAGEGGIQRDGSTVAAEFGQRSGEGLRRVARGVCAKLEDQPFGGLRRCGEAGRHVFQPSGVGYGLRRNLQREPAVRGLGERG